MPAPMRTFFFMIRAPFLPVVSYAPPGANVEVPASIIGANPMRLRPLIPLALALGGAPFALAQAPAPTCPPSPSPRPCDTVHHHVPLDRPATPQFPALSGIN